MQPAEQARKINKVIAKTWMDEGFKKKLLANPTKALQEEGVEIPPGIEIRIAAETDNVRYLVLPLRPPSEEMSEEQLSQVAGGMPGYCRIYTLACNCIGG